MSRRDFSIGTVRPMLVSRRNTLAMLSSSAVLAACGDGDDGWWLGPTPTPTPTPAPTPTPTPTPVSGPPWFGFARDPQHTAASTLASQDLGRVAWSSPVDLVPQYAPNNALLAHYGSPVVTMHNTVVVPVKTTATGGYRIEGRDGATGALLWLAPTDFVPAPNPSIYQNQPYNVLLTQQGRLYAPGAGGKLLVRDDSDAASGAFASQLFYGTATYNRDPAAFDGSVFIHTPLTADAQGNVFFGFQVTATNPAGLLSGIARVSASGTGAWVGAAVASDDPIIQKPVTNCAPAISLDGSTIYIAVHAVTQSGYTQAAYLLALDSTTLATRAKVALVDPNTLTPARLDDYVTSSPVIGPDGRVFYGVLEVIFDVNNARGWLLQFDAQLKPVGARGSFGRDASPSVIPASMVPSYSGTSTYLLAINYNNYLGEGSGNGLNRLAILDPTASQPASQVPTVMREVLTVLAPTPDGNSPTARREWCINTMAADPFRRSILANNEDGVLYRWDLATNMLAESVRLTSGIHQAYTPTLVGADGAVYAISNGTLFSVRAS